LADQRPEAIEGELRVLAGFDFHGKVAAILAGRNGSFLPRFGEYSAGNVDARTPWAGSGPVSVALPSSGYFTGNDRPHGPFGQSWGRGDKTVSGGGAM